ncbi:MAG TPA: hypothetical protein VI756_18090, partial [Blastocatellia bacterium]
MPKQKKRKERSRPRAPESRRVEELIVRYKLEPTLNDVYVEGPADARLIDWFLSENDLEDVAVYDISTVHLPAETLLERGLPDNNKGRVIALAEMLEPHISQRTGQTTCVVDQDLDIVLEKTREHELLVLTDYTCLEMYSYDVDSLNKFLR